MRKNGAQRIKENRKRACLTGQEWIAFCPITPLNLIGAKGLRFTNVSDKPFFTPPKQNANPPACLYKKAGKATNLFTGMRAARWLPPKRRALLFGALTPKALKGNAEKITVFYC